MSKQNRKMWVLGHKITPIEVSGNYDMVMGETAPQVPGPPPHYHSKLHEVFMVIEGEMEFLVDGEITIIQKGESVNFPPSVVHTFKNNSSTPCTWINIHSPKGFQKFFEQTGISIEEADAQTKSVDESIIKRVMETASHYDMHIKV